MRITALLLALLLAACQAAAPPPRTGEGPTGTGYVQHERGFSALCKAHPHEGTCP